jgi:hypothetical protein
VSPELAARDHARLAETKAESAGRNEDPLATLWRGFALCGHCGRRLHTAQAASGNGRRYKCLAHHADPVTGQRVPCPGGAFTMNASTLDAAAWADVRRWLSSSEEVGRLLADWEALRTEGEHSLSSRLDAADGQIAALRAKMSTLAETIAETSNRESRAVLQAKLDTYAEQVHREEGKRERLVREAAQAADYAAQARSVRDWVSVVAAEAETFTPAEQRDTLKALGAEVRVWREDYAHPDGWTQRYRVTLNFTGLTGQPVTLPASHIVTPAS